MKHDMNKKSIKAATFYPTKFIYTVYIDLIKGKKVNYIYVLCFYEFTLYTILIVSQPSDTRVRVHAPTKQLVSEDKNKIHRQDALHKALLIVVVVL